VHIYVEDKFDKMGRKNISWQWHTQADVYAWAWEP